MLFFLISLILGVILAIVLRKLKTVRESNALSEERIRGLVQNYDKIIDKEHKIKNLDAEIVELQNLLDHRQEELDLLEQHSKLYEKDLLDRINYLNLNIKKLREEQRIISEEIDKKKKPLYAIQKDENEIQEKIRREVVEKIVKETEIIIQQEQNKQKQLLNRIQELENRPNLSNPHYDYEQQLSQLAQERRELYKINENLQQLINSQRKLVMEFKVEYEAIKSDRSNLDNTGFIEKYNRLMRAAYHLVNDGVQPKTVEHQVGDDDPFNLTPSEIWRGIRENG
jgi:chromosome segregation ATPase